MGKYRKFTAEKKLRIVLEGMRDWKKKAKRAAKEGLKPRKNGKAKELKRKDEE